MIAWRAEPEAEDIFATHLAYLFTDHIPNAHGDPGTSIVYKSPYYGNIRLQIPEHAQLGNGKQLFAHFLWNAAVIAAEAIESASIDEVTRHARTQDNQDPWQQYEWDQRYWDMRGADILELGAGTALPSIISHLCGARSLTITDHPSSTAVTTNTIQTNIAHNTTHRIQTDKPAPAPGTAANAINKEAEVPPNVNIYGYLWGETRFYHRQSHVGTSNPDDTPLALLPEASSPALKSFNKIIVADCLWIPSKHSSICKTILDYLDDQTTAQQTTQAQPCALVIAGFHTGRAITSDFFAVATDSHVHTRTRVHYDEGPIYDEDPLTDQVRGKLRTAEIFEIDIDGRRREWKTSRPGESVDDAKRWCVCAVLVRR